MLRWLLLAAVLNLVFAVAHCSAGDVLIALVCYLVASAVTLEIHGFHRMALTPLLQWLVLPLIALWLIRTGRRPT